jgi:hypothetical protein
MKATITGPYNHNPEGASPSHTFIGVLTDVAIENPRGGEVLGSYGKIKEIETLFVINGFDTSPSSPFDVRIALSFREATLLADALNEQLKNYREIQVSKLVRKPKQL